MSEQGGDPACWADQVCDECGALVDSGIHQCPRVHAVARTITGFRHDKAGVWVAELSCWHRQHVRHAPPFQDRPWVLTEEGRNSRLGTDIECPLCSRAELPPDMAVRRTIGPFDDKSLPAGLLRDHMVGEGWWGRLTVLQGEVGVTLRTVPPTVKRLGVGDRQPLPPGVAHSLQLQGPVRLEVEFLAPVWPADQGSAR